MKFHFFLTLFGLGPFFWILDVSTRVPIVENSLICDGWNYHSNVEICYLATFWKPKAFRLPVVLSMVDARMVKRSGHRSTLWSLPPLTAAAQTVVLNNLFAIILVAFLKIMLFVVIISLFRVPSIGHRDKDMQILRHLWTYKVNII